MDYETPDGSQFSLREVWTKRGEEPVFDYTTVSAYVGGIAYVGKLHQRPDEVDEGDVLNSLEPVSPECIHPKSPSDFTTAPAFDPVKHHLKAPSFTYDDCRPGKTLLADCVLNEVTVLEQLKRHPHPNLVSYYGCVIEDGLITHLCLQRYPHSLGEYVDRGVSEAEKVKIHDGVRDGIRHLHSFGLAHNDVTPLNVCINDHGEAIIVDFDSCLPFGQRLIKGIGCEVERDFESAVSRPENDLVFGLDEIKDFLWPATESGLHDDPFIVDREPGLEDTKEAGLISTRDGQRESS